jgi:NAD(P)-dependent dehydrogenase (short-subunit alcohol dehydrogenase family)
MDVAGKAAVVTGGGSGIGRGIALALARAGASVGVADIMLDNARAIAAEIEAAGGTAVALRCDVTDRASVIAMKAEANKALGPVQLLVANAGVTMFELLEDMSDAEVDWVIDVSLYGVVHCVQAFQQDMIAVGEGHIVATASTAGLMAPFHERHAPYCGAKAGIIGFMLALRRDLEKHHVGASVLCPGFVASSITQSHRYRPEAYGGPNEREVVLPLQGENHLAARPAEEAGEMVLHAIQRNRAVITTDANLLQAFEAGMVAMVREAFADAAEYDRLKGR